MQSISFRPPLFFNDNGFFVGAIYTLKLHSKKEIVITAKSSKDEINNWIILVANDVTEFGYKRSFFKERITLFKRLQSNGLNIKPAVKDTIKGINDSINDWLISRRTKERGSIEDALIETRIDEFVKYKKDLEKVLSFKINPSGKPFITQEDVYRAKEFPITSLVDFNNANFANCIFHDEKTASMRYYEKTNSVHCFGCGKTGDAITVYQQLYKTPFIDTVKILIK